jgi:hypothetical protein
MAANATVVIWIAFNAWLRRGGDCVRNNWLRNCVAVIAIELGDGLAMIFVFETRVVARNASRRGWISGGGATPTILLRGLASLLRLDCG